MENEQIELPALDESIMKSIAELSAHLDANAAIGTGIMAVRPMVANNVLCGIQERESQLRAAGEDKNHLLSVIAELRAALAKVNASGGFNVEDAAKQYVRTMTDDTLANDDAGAHFRLVARAAFIAGSNWNAALASADGEKEQAQIVVADWCLRAFGADQASSVPQRGLRHLEEAGEVAQASGVDREQAHKLIDYIWERPTGELSQEIGGSRLTLLALAAAAHVDAEECEAREIERVLSKPVEHFTKRNQAKNDAGFLAASPTRVEQSDSSGAIA